MKEAKRSSSGFSNREVHKSKKTYRGRSFFDKQLNSEYNPNAKLIFLGLAFIAILIGGFALSQGTLFHSSMINPNYSDPFQILWHDTSPNNNGPSQFNCVSHTANCFNDTFINGGSGPGNLVLTPNSTQSSVAITLSTIDLSTVASKELLAQFSWEAKGSFVQNVPFGWYLTTNGTLPTQPNYDPRTDRNVALLATTTETAPATWAQNIFFLRTLGKSDTILSEDTGCPSGSAYLCSTYSSSHASTAFQDWDYFLNFTGGSSNTVGCTFNAGAASWSGPGCSWRISIDNFAGVFTGSSSQVLPWLNFQTQQYYLGMYAFKGFGGSILYTFDGSLSTLGLGPETGLNTQGVMALDVFVPTTGSSVPPNVDTGGFFGPIIKALISVGVFIAQNIINFLNFLSSIFAPLLAGIIAVFGTVFTLVFNAIGGIFGDSSLGTQIGTFFSGLSSYLANTFSSAITFLSTAVTFLSNALSVLSAFFSGGNSFIGLWTNLLSGLASLISGLSGFLTILLYFYNLGVFGFNIIIIMLVGILAVSAVLDWIQTDNAVAGFVAIIMTFFLLYVLQTNNSSLNVIATNASILTSYQAAWNNTLFFVKLAPVLFFAMFMEWINGMDEVQRIHGGTEFMPNFQSMLKFDIMITTDIFKGGYWFFKEAFDLVSKGLSAIKGRWSPVEVAGTG